MKKVGFALLIGLLGGAAVGYTGADFIRAHLGGDRVEATVVAKRRDDERLVLTLRAEDRTFMATYTSRLDDTDALVAVNDTIVITAPHDGVFADDVPILAVVHQDAAATESEATESGDESNAGASGDGETAAATPSDSASPEAQEAHTDAHADPPEVALASRRRHG